MSSHNLMTSAGRAARRVAAAVLLAGLSTGVPLAQQPVLRHDAAPAAPAVPIVGHVAAHAPAPQPVGGSGLAFRGAQTAPLRLPGAQPLVLNRSTIGGASFTRPGPALLPLGGPAKPGATSINGTSIRPKH
jgi:hypothetical protein